MYIVLIKVQHTVHMTSTGLLTTNNKIVMFVKSLINIMYSVLIKVQHTVHMTSTGLFETKNKIEMFVNS